MKKLLVLLTLSSVACGDEPDFVTKHGIRFFDETSDQRLSERIEEIENTTDVFLRYLIGGERLLKKVDVHVQDGPFEAFGSLKAGSYNEIMGDIRMMNDEECWPNSAFLHELTHHFAWHRDGDADGDHSELKWWGRTSPQAQGSAVGMRELCQTN